MLRLLSIADIISIINALFGFSAIIMAFLGEIWLSFSFILLALLADGLDGIVARKTKQGKLGEYLEAMGDMTSLGIAPAFFVFTTYYENICYCNYYRIYLVAALIIFLSLNIIRLASFHIMKKDNYFVGLPASVGTIIILVLAYLEVEFLYLLLVIILVSLTLVSNIKFPKPGLKINGIAAILIILTIILGKNYYGIAPLLLLIAILIYAVSGPAYLLRSK